MELPFDVAARLGFPSSAGPCIGKIDKTCSSEVADVVDALCDRSASARGLKTEKPTMSTMGFEYIHDEDNSLPSIRSSDDTVYLMAEGSDVLGLARVGVRSIMVKPPQAEGEPTVSGYSEVNKDACKVHGGSTGDYTAHTSSLQKITPCCLLEFVVVESLQHRGLGRLLFDAMMSGESVQDPCKIAYYRPSDAMSAFLTKHFGLTGGKKVAESYLLFDKYFEKSQNVPDVAPVACHGTSNVVESKTKDESDGKLEDELYKHHAQLFCFNDNTWQNAGNGQVSMLKHANNGKIRLTFMQDSTQRVIANHLIINRAPFCDLQRHKAGNDKTWTWQAEDPQSANGEPRYAMKFKTSEDAAKFKETFEEAKRCSVETDAVEYVVVRKVGATAESDIHSRHVKLISTGTIVSVVQVLYLAEAKRVRARLVKPAGWITLMSHNAADVGNYAIMRSDLESYSQEAMPSGSATWRCTTISGSVSH